jgi:hypothetical protein
MRSEDIFLTIVKLENGQPPCTIEWRSINMWPLIRQCVWRELISDPIRNDNFVSRIKSVLARILNKFVRALGRRGNTDTQGKVAENIKNGAEETAIISRPPYLQRLPNGKLFDRIVDPLIFASWNRINIAKYYISPLPENVTLYYPASNLRGNPGVGKPSIPENVHKYLEGIANMTGVDANRLKERYTEALRQFNYWYEAGVAFLTDRSKIKTIYITSWYFPDMMGITAAARERGITVIDVQHGKQGKFQPMYSGWNKIPDQGYQMMPDRFWCWGQTSCDHMLAASPHRKVHLPFVGGYPWLDYYRKYVSKASDNRQNDGEPKWKRRILMTTQPVRLGNTEPIPDFLFNYLQYDSTGLNHFVFRCHYNDRNGPAYCRQRLASIPPHLYSIDEGKGNLYDKLLQATHHITEYSSCCYEADAFGVPTLIYGQDAKAIYSEEIDSGVFTWTEGTVEGLANWLETDSQQADVRHMRAEPYMVSSLAIAADIMISNAV